MIDIIGCRSSTVENGGGLEVDRKRNTETTIRKHAIKTQDQIRSGPESGSKSRAFSGLQSTRFRVRGGDHRVVLETCFSRFRLGPRRIWLQDSRGSDSVCGCRCVCVRSCVCTYVCVEVSPYLIFGGFFPSVVFG